MDTRSLYGLSPDGLRVWARESLAPQDADRIYARINAGEDLEAIALTLEQWSEHQPGF